TAAFCRLICLQPLSVQLERPRLDSNNSAFLLELFLSRFEHLIVACLFHSISYQLLTDRLFVIARAWPVHPVAAIIRRDFPFFLHLRSLRGFFPRRRQGFAQQLASSLVPVGVSKFLRIALIDHRDLSRAGFDLFGRGSA